MSRIKKWAKANSEIFIGQPPTGTRNTEQWHVKSLKSTKPDMDANMNSSAFLKWAQSHDVIEEVSDLVLDQSTATDFPLGACIFDEVQGEIVIGMQSHAVLAMWLLLLLKSRLWC